ncbi:uncharacterized protein LOC119081447 isoform X3 [Bradysia coprophila]|uniref:uncharacterized protein LOC119081447 isoform X3 n=1 Tax=Bradysia coprophila TaxID=38358 RepID=UPI00187D9310|nr:uncharacterized protein LOC119081447 isoform X3 [Bradysia coprophila]
MHRIFTVIGTILVYTKYAYCDQGIDLYSVRYNNLDIDTILNSDRLVTNYVECLLSRKPCSPEGKELKRILPEALRTKCGRCSNSQKEVALKVLKKLYVYYPKHYNDLRAKWDQTGEYHRRFEEYLREERFNTISGDTDRDQTQVVQKISPQNPITTPASTTAHQISTLDTQRPARNPDDVQQNPTLNQFDLFNRFGGEDDENDQTARIPSVQAPSMTAPQQHTVKTPSSTNPTYLPPFMTSSSLSNTNSFSTARPSYPSVNPTKATSPPVMTTNRPVTEKMPSATTTVLPSVATIRPIDYFFVPPVYQPPNGQGPIANLIHRLGYKISNTADFLAEMLRGTVKTFT